MTSTHFTYDRTESWRWARLSAQFIIHKFNSFEGTKSRKDFLKYSYLAREQNGPPQKWSNTDLAFLHVVKLSSGETQEFSALKPFLEHAVARKFCCSLWNFYDSPLRLSRSRLMRVQPIKVRPGRYKICGLDWNTVNETKAVTKVIKQTGTFCLGHLIDLSNIYSIDVDLRHLSSFKINKKR
jgi:hypothetical protein